MNEATQQYVRQHADDDVRQLALRGCKDPEVDMSLALQQIQGRQTARRKLPTWAACEGVCFPPHLNMEQCSSEPAARYKAALCRRLLAAHPSPTTLVDLTGGFGVDFTFMSAAFDQATYVERDEQLFAISSANIRLLVATPTTLVCADGTEYFRTVQRATMFFLDPARRDDHGARTYGMADCTPDVLTMKDELLSRSSYVLLKLSPMLDWRKAVDDLGRDCVREVHIVAVGGECKELLVLLSAEGEGMRLCCVNDETVFSVDLSDAASDETDEIWGSPVAGNYLYEPHAAIMKGGCFAALSRRYGVQSVARNSHLFVSPHPVADFPGRMFRISAVATMNKHDLRRTLGDLRRASITVRNFPLSVADLRKRLRLTDGGDTYLFATTLADGSRVLLVCHRSSPPKPSQREGC